jgi:hypothetical protein
MNFTQNSEGWNLTKLVPDNLSKLLHLDTLSGSNINDYSNTFNKSYMNQTSNTKPSKLIHWIYFIGDIAIMGWSEECSDNSTTKVYAKDIDDLDEFASNIYKNSDLLMDFPELCEVAFIDWIP